MSRLIALNNRQFSYEDACGPGVPVLALHGSFGRGKTFAKVAEAQHPHWWSDTRSAASRRTNSRRGGLNWCGRW